MAWTDRDPPPYLFFIGAALVAGCGVGFIALPAMFDPLLVLGACAGRGVHDLHGNRDIPMALTVVFLVLAVGAGLTSTRTAA